MNVVIVAMTALEAQPQRKERGNSAGGKDLSAQQGAKPFVKAR